MLKLNPTLHLNPNLLSPEVELVANRNGFGTGLVEAGKKYSNIVALSADLTESTKMDAFREAFPDRFIEIGVAEQNLVTVAAGLSLVSKIPFVTSYAGFSPGRNWEQIRTTVALNQTNVKIIGSHAGVSVGPDGATHQMLEDIALMRAMPEMMVIVPADVHEAHRATLALAASPRAAYMRLAREKTAVITTEDTPFTIGRAQVLAEGSDLTIVACGPLVHEAVKAAAALDKKGTSVEVINSPSIKPLDRDTILQSARKTGAVVTVEEAQINGGLGGAVAELLIEHHPVPMQRIGIGDRFGQSGTITELWEEYQLSAKYIIQAAITVLKRKEKA